VSLPAAARARIDRVARAERQSHLGPEPAPMLVAHEVIVGLRPAMEAAAARMRRTGLPGYIVQPMSRGHAATEGSRIARALATHGGPFHMGPEGRLDGPFADGPPTARWLVLGGEPVVDLRGAPADAHGGRCQELALAAARELHERGERHVTLLAAGTDGRDGPTDAAGAIVDGDTWAAIARAGRDPAADLAAHRSYAALDAAGALLRTGLTGTNVNDIVVAVRAPARG
jgi:hydroxypyruvate reductase